MANTANTALTTNFNVTPYYDDYDESKNYYRILYKPGFAVQARELTQMQSILQKQIERHGRHIFTEGTIVIPGSFQLFCANTTSSVGPLSYVKVADIGASNNNVKISDFDDLEIVGQTSGVKALVNITIDKTDNPLETNTLYVDYLNVSNANSSIVTFQPGETLFSNVGSLKVLDTNPTGFGSAFRITEGVVFSKGHFIYFPTQEVVLDRYNDTPTCKVGFKIVETIVTADADSSLLDPALEASNYFAPGADRFNLEAELQVRNIDDSEDLPNFVTLFTIKDGIVQTFSDRTAYSIIKDEWAKRTFDESGDYYVSGLNVELREHNDTGTNGGVFANGNNALISVKVEPGVAYVKGYEIGTLDPRFLTTEKSITFSNVENQIASAFFGSYITVDEMVGHLPTDKGVQIDLYDTNQNRISNGTFSTTGVVPAGQKIGTARLASIEYNSGVLGTATGQSDVYLMDIRMIGSNSFNSVKSVFVNNLTTPDFVADIVPDPANGRTVLYEPFNSSLLYYTGSDYTRKIKGTNGSSDTSFEYMPTVSVSITNGAFSVSAPGSDSVPYTGTLSTSNKREIFLTITSAVNVSIGVSATNTGTTISGTNIGKLNVGDKVEFAGVTGTYTVTSKSGVNAVVIDRLPSSTVSSAQTFKAYKTGDFVDLTTTGFTSGVDRSVSVSGTSLSFDLGEAITTTATVTFRAAKTTAIEASKVLKPSRYVQINCASHSAGVNGPYNLGFSDVLRIKSIRKKSSSLFSSNNEGTVVTSQFIFDNGQKDTHYDFATITPVVPLSVNDRLLIELDYFLPDYSEGKGYFSVDSYPTYDEDPLNTITATSENISIAEIPIFKSPTSGKSYDLRNHLDFRPVKALSAEDATILAEMTTNPVASDGFNYSGTNIALVAPSSEIRYDYSYYLARKDVIHLNKDKVFSITKGVPAPLPITPQISENEMALATMQIAPYPSISPYYAKIIGRQDIGSTVRKIAPIRQTMRDIGVMKERITNLEYYASLSLLEKSAVEMLITDENGEDRFKNGIFVDTFTDHLLGATYDEDYRIVVDPQEKSIRPLYSMHSIEYDYLPDSGSNVKVSSGNVITLDYDEVEYANIVSATSTLNTEKSTYRFVGNMTLVPENDIWIDTITLPPNTISINDANLDGMQDAQQVGGMTTTWNAWQTRVVGYKVYVGGSSAGTLVGTYASQAEADRAAQNTRTLRNGATIETIFENSRTGTENFNFSDSDTTSIGSRVVNTEVVPYIRPQTLMGSVTGLKPFANFKIYFDSIDMSSYTRPITEEEFGNISNVKTWTNNLGDNLISNSEGEIWFRLSLPNTDNLRFTVGQKKVVITDSLTNAEQTTTSFAEKMFFAQGVIQTKQDTILSTRQTEVRQFAVSQSTNSSTFSTLPALPPPPPNPPTPERDDGGSNWMGPTRRSNQCLAYVLPIKAPAGEEGIFLTSVEVYCSQKHPTLGVWFEVREIDAGGNITLNQVPFSEKWYKNVDVPLSSNGITNGLRVTFDAPIFLYADKSYAFVIHPEAGNPNYYFWISRIGETDVNTREQVTSRAYTGTTYTTNNDTIWIPQDQIDITCKWYRASFELSGEFEIGNAPREKIYINDLVGSIEGFGEPIITGDRLTLSGYSGAAITANDYIVGNTSSVNAKVLSVSSGTYLTSNIRFAQNESVTIRYASNAAVKGTANIASVENGRGFLEYYKDTANGTYLILNDSNGRFSVGETLFDISDEGSARIESIRNQRYSLIDFEPAIINFAKTSQVFELSTYSNLGAAQPYTTIDSGENYEFDTEMSLYSRANERSSLSSDRSNKVRVTMSTSSEYLSPVFDLGRTQSIIVDNIINNDATNETNPKGGSLFNKYISKIVTLAEGQDAEDLRVYLTAYRPPNTDVKVWMKLLNGEDSDTMALKSWIELEKTYGGNIMYSSLANKKDFKEYTFSIPSSYLTGAQGQMVYTNSQGISFTGFKTFQVKIGLTSTSSAIIPRVADLRVIALQI